jgi:cell division initiation protein
MEITARDIQDKQFHDAWRGYRQEEVDDFLDQVSEALDAYQRENAALKDRAAELEQAVATARDTEEMLKKTLVTAQKAAEEAIASAKAKAERIIGEAEQRAARANDEAKERSAATDAEVRRKVLEADRAQTMRKRELESTIERLTTYEGELKQRLKTYLEAQLKGLDALTDKRPAARSAEMSRSAHPSGGRGSGAGRPGNGSRGRGAEASSAPDAGPGGRDVAVLEESDEGASPEQAHGRDADADRRSEAPPHRRSFRELFARDDVSEEAASEGTDAAPDERA